MTSKKEIENFITSQKSIWLYGKVQRTLYAVLSALPDKDYRKVTKNLILMVLHEGALGQVMHFPNPKGEFRVLQLIFPDKIPTDVLRFVIAHELGHVMQGRNWRKSDETHLEEDADEHATKWGFPKTKFIAKWMGHYGAKYGF